MKGFISYSTEDARSLQSLATHLRSSIESDCDIEFWAAPALIAGTKWEQEVENYIAMADVVLLLISPSFLTSDIILNMEVPAILKRYAVGKTQVIPIQATP